MSTSQSTPNSRSAHDEQSEPSSTPELQSAPIGNISTSSQELDVVTITDDEQVDKELRKGKSDAWNHFDKVRIDGLVKAVYHPELASYSFSHDGAKNELAKMIIMHEYPLSIVDHIGFKRYSSYLQPLFKVPCRNTIKNEIFHIYEFEKAKTLSLLESNSSRVAITTDMWTATNQKKGYMAVTSHYIDASWILQSRIMRGAATCWSMTWIPTKQLHSLVLCGSMSSHADKVKSKLEEHLVPFS
ncbi:hypothetical protein AgCh_004687 [Apium graveolens]